MFYTGPTSRREPPGRVSECGSGGPWTERAPCSEQNHRTPPVIQSFYPIGGLFYTSHGKQTYTNNAYCATIYRLLFITVIRGIYIVNLSRRFNSLFTTTIDM